MIIIKIKEENIKYYCCASRGRDPDNPSDRSGGNPNLEQRLEINWGVCEHDYKCEQRFLDIRNI